jgi:DNA topoisomerase IB
VTVVHLVAKTALRAGRRSYARERDATTLLKSNVEIDGLLVRLHFRGSSARACTS